MMDFVISQQLAKARYEEMLEDAANERRANAYVVRGNGLDVMSVLNNVAAELKLFARGTRRASTRI